MTIILLLCAFWGAILCYFICAPFFSTLEFFEQRKLNSFTILCILGFFTATGVPILPQRGAIAAPSPQVTVPSSVQIPPPVFLPENGYILPSVNQYILMPLQGRLLVYYVGMFSNDGNAKEGKILLPLPKGFENLHISENNKVTNISHSSLDSVASYLLQKGVNQVNAEFSLPASTGVASFEPSSALSVLPGVTLIMMPQYEGILRDIFSTWYSAESLNLWPSRFAEIPKDFKVFLEPDPMENPSNLSSKNAGLSMQLVRVGNDKTSFPKFKIIGLVPSRIPIYILAAFFFLLVFIVALFSSAKKNSKPLLAH